MKKVILIFLLVFNIACDKDFSAPKPDILLEQEKIENILYDIKLLSASKSKYYKMLKDNNIEVAPFIFDKYAIDSTTLSQNIAYYATHSFEKAKEIEKNIELRLGNKLKEIEASLKIEDSLRLSSKQKRIIQRESKNLGTLK